jgi:SAM-dependent methyltransferase
MFSKLKELVSQKQKPKKHYGINAEYVINTKVKYCDKRRFSPEKEAQKEVYQKALKLVRTHDFESILDIGCGSGWKLLHYFAGFRTLGLEVPKTLRWLKQQYPQSEWALSDFNASLDKPYDMVICADVIEHLSDPDELIDYMKRVDFKRFIMSTPERGAIQMYQEGRTWNGPPKSNKHVREWSFSEFAAYLGQHFDILEHYYDCPTTCEKRAKVNQVVVGRKLA